MRRNASVLLSLPLLVAVSLAQEARADPAAFLAEARKVHADLTARGLRSFSAEMLLRRSADVNLRRYRHLAGFGYSWAEGEKGKFDFEKTHETLRKPLEDALRDLWRDVTGVLWFDVLVTCQDLRMETVADRTVVSGKIEGKTEIRASFETAARVLVELEVPARNARVAIVYERAEGGLRVCCREVTVNGARAYRIRYGVFRTVSGYELPTVLKLDSKANSTAYRVRYRTVNGEPASMDAIPDKVVKERVATFEEGWRKWTEWERMAEIEELSEIDHDLASAAIARRGLKDRSPDVRVTAAEALGVMRRDNVVPALIAAMKKAVKEIEVYLRLIEALGEIGNPRAVDILSKDWWNQRVGEHAVAAVKAKIHALGCIRHVTAVDALIAAFFIAKEESIGLYKTDLVVALMKLTGQDFRHDRRAWKDWWKKNRNRHRF